MYTPLGFSPEGNIYMYGGQSPLLYLVAKDGRPETNRKFGDMDALRPRRRKVARLMDGNDGRKHCQR